MSVAKLQIYYIHVPLSLLFGVHKRKEGGVVSDTTSGFPHKFSYEIIRIVHVHVHTMYVCTLYIHVHVYTMYMYRGNILLYTVMENET